MGGTEAELRRRIDELRKTGFAAVTQQISLESVNAAIREKFPAKVAEANVAAAAEAFAFVAQQLREAADA